MSINFGESFLTIYCDRVIPISLFGGKNLYFLSTVFWHFSRYSRPCSEYCWRAVSNHRALMHMLKLVRNGALFRGTAITVYVNTHYECVAIRIIVAFDDTFIFLYCMILLYRPSIVLCCQCSFILLVYGFIQYLVESYYCLMLAVVIDARKSIYCNECILL